MNKMSRLSKINYLGDFAKALKNDSELACIQRKIVFLMELERFNNPLEAAAPVTTPDEYDVVITEIRDSDFVEIGAEMGVQRLTRTESVATFQ